MIRPAEIRTKASRKYHAFLKSWLKGEAFFPLAVPGKMASSKTEWGELQRWLEELVGHSKARKGKGYEIAWRNQVKTRSHGPQSLPRAIQIPTQEDFLSLIGKKEEFKRFCQSVTLIRGQFPSLNGWMQLHPKKVIDHLGEWDYHLQVVQYFLDHPRPQLYLRDLPLELDTKFVENRKGILRELLDQVLPPASINTNAADFEERFGLQEKPFMVRIRLLDDQWVRRFNLPANDLILPREDLVRLDFSGATVVISENLMPYLTLPEIDMGVAIWGEGASVTGIKLPWLETCPILYWGDLDVQGFQFLDRFRALYPQVKSILMDEETWEQHQSFRVKGTVDSKKEPLHLTDAELQLYRVLKAGNGRLEQERISWSWRKKFWQDHLS